MPRIALDLPTHLIDIPSGHSSKRYYIPLYNIHFGGARDLISHWLHDCGVIDWQFHNDAKSGWVCLGDELDFDNALDMIQQMKQLHPKLEYSAVNKLQSFKLEVIDCTLTQPRFVRFYSNSTTRTPRHGNRLMDWIRLDLPSHDLQKTRRILLAGLAHSPSIHELNRWIRYRLGTDCLLVVASRVARIGVAHALVFICTLAMTDDLSEDKVRMALEGAAFGSETVRVVVERPDADTGASNTSQDAVPLVVLGSTKLPPRWPSMVSRWNLSSSKKRRECVLEV